MANERQRASDVTPDDFDKRTVDRWPVDSVHVPFTVTDEVYGDPLDWQTLIGGVRGCIGTP